MRSRSKRLPPVLLLVIPIAAGANDKEGPAVKAARESFEKVESSAGIPARDDVQACLEAQPEAEKSTAKSDRLILQGRRAYCDFLKAALAQDSPALLESAAALTDARGNGKNDSAPVLKVAAAIAILKSNLQGPPAPGAVQDLQGTLNCLSAGFADTRTCNALDRAAHLWIGYAALSRSEFDQAAQAFRYADGSPWNAWLTGVQLERAQKWQEAALAFADAFRMSAVRGKNLAEWLGPQLAAGELPARLAYAEVMAGDWRTAGPHLDAAIAARPDDARSLFLRSRLQGSLPDLEAAAKAATGKPGESHFYQAILLARRHDYPAATREFNAALDAGPDSAMRNDIPAWKLLTGAAAGECTEDPDVTVKSAASASPLFPKEELASELLDCRVRRSASLEQLIALDAILRPRAFAQSGNDMLREHIAAAYNRFGVQAEDRKDTDGAAGAYRRALAWAPRNTKARFNLGSLFLAQKRFGEAEAEYRAVLAAEPADREAQFWLGEAILGSGPDEGRKVEACGLLQQSIKIQDSAKRDQFAVAFSTSPCAK